MRDSAEWERRFRSYGGGAVPKNVDVRAFVRDVQADALRSAIADMGLRRYRDPDLQQTVDAWLADMDRIVTKLDGRP